MLEKLKARIVQIEEAIKNSASNHSMLLGHLAEAQNVTKMIEEDVAEVAKVAAIVEPVVSALVPGAQPVVEAISEL